MLCSVGEFIGAKQLKVCGERLYAVGNPNHLWVRDTLRVWCLWCECPKTKLQPL